MLKTLSSAGLCAAGCLGIWLLTLSSVSGEELFVGSVCALASGAAGVGAKRAAKARWSVRAAPLRLFLRVPAAVVGDAVQVLLRPVLPLRRPAKVVTLDLRQRGDSAAATSLRLVSALAVTSAPGSLVLDLDAASGRLTLHSLQPAGVHVEDGLQGQ
ncbi:MAG TPA: Na+/H+ antiporter subunit E [Acidimicrobiales bacterium]|jgi:multisubunit Na+/H+ antiporter MnhE subunit|nr:Na+/H+ antiporter subunit E [Acidimicrobiales bacterium]